MEKILSIEQFGWKSLSLAILVVGMALAMVVVVYGMESVVSGVHDAFHDFRHTIGMPCH